MTDLTVSKMDVLDSAFQGELADACMTCEGSHIREPIMLNPQHFVRSLYLILPCCDIPRKF